MARTPLSSGMRGSKSGGCSSRRPCWENQAPRLRRPGVFRMTFRRWAYRDPFYAPMAAGRRLRMPGLFRWGMVLPRVFELLTASQTLYRMRPVLRVVARAERDTLDSRAYYAAKTGTDGSWQYLYGWNPTGAARRKHSIRKPHQPDCCSWTGAANLVVHELLQNRMARCASCRRRTWDAARCKRGGRSTSPRYWAAARASPHAVAAGGLRLCRCAAGPDTGAVQAQGEVRFKPGTQRFGIALQVDEQYDTGYTISTSEPRRNRLSTSPASAFWGPDGEGDKMFPMRWSLERPFAGGRPFLPFKIFVQDSVLVVYFGGESR